MTDWTGGPDKEWQREMEEDTGPVEPIPIQPKPWLTADYWEAAIVPEGTWSPPYRDTRTGHRVSLRPGWRPIETRKLPARLWIPELIMRAVARYVGNARWYRPEVWFQEERDREPEPDPDQPTRVERFTARKRRELP
jgi:hypothetical protein